MSAQLFAMVALGGASGALCRYLCYEFLNPLTRHLPLGQIAANIVGCFLAGLAIQSLERFSIEMRHFYIVGFLGSLTTMSAFAFDVNVFWQGRQFWQTAVLWSTGAFLCVMATCFGMFLVQR